MPMMDFSRGELSPNMRYRSDLESYHKGVEALERFMPTPKGGLVRGPGCQVLELLPPSDRPPAVRLFSLGSTGLDAPIAAVGTGDTVTIGDGVYDTEFRVHDIPKDEEIDILLSFTEFGGGDDIVAHWVNTPDGNPAFLQRVFNYDPGFTPPPIDFDDTRDVRVVQVENNVYVIAKTQIYRLFWDKNKTIPEWSSSEAYTERDVVTMVVGDVSYFFECVEGGQVNQDPTTLEGSPYWRVVYPPLMSWEVVSPRVGYELLKGIGTDDDPYSWTANAVWGGGYTYYQGDVVSVSDIYYECVEEYESPATPPSVPPNGSGQPWVILTDLSTVTPDTIEMQDDVFRRSSYAFREETIPRQMVVHHNRLIFAGSSVRPSTIQGSEVYHYLNFGAGINDDEPWIVTVSGDKVGRILWMTVTDQLYIGTSGGIFAVSGVLTPTSFNLRKVTSHAASVVEAVAAAGSVLFFHKDGKTLREIEYADQAENYRAFDLTVYSDHLFEEFKAVKMVVVNDPSIVIWILREDGTLVSLSYEKTTGLYAFARHELHGSVYDIVAGKNNELYGIVILDSTDVRQLIRIGGKDLTYGDIELEDVHLDGLVSFANTDPSNEFAVNILNDDIRAWYEENGITSISDMFDWSLAIDASDQGLSGALSDCGLSHLDEIPSLDLSGNSLSGNVPPNLINLMADSIDASLNLSGNPLTIWDLPEIPGSWVSLILSNTSFPLGQVELIIDSVIASESSSPRSGVPTPVLDLRGLGVLSADDAIEKAVSLKGAGWNILIDNLDGWDDEYVTFNGNGNTSGSSPDQMLCLYKQEIALPSNGTLVKTDYEFIGWSLYPSGEDTISAGNTFKKDTQGGVVLYAVWIPNNAVGYIANGGSGAPIDSTLYNPGETVTVKTSSISKPGYSLIGWVFNTGGTPLIPGDTFEMPDHAVELIATWQANTYTVTFSLNGAQQGAVPSSISMVYGGAPITLPDQVATLHKESSGYFQTFRRWNTAPDPADGSPKNVGAAYSVPPHNVTLYAEFRDYDPGDDGPHGGVITQDLGSYATRKINVSGLAGYARSYVWRYIEMLRDDGIPLTDEGKSLSSPNVAIRNVEPVIDGVTWYMVDRSYFTTALTSGHLDNLSETRYWNGYISKSGVWVFTKYYFHFVDKNTGVEYDTKDNNRRYGIRLGRGT